MLAAALFHGSASIWDLHQRKNPSLSHTVFFFSKEGKERHSLALPFKASILCSLHHLCPLLGKVRVVKPHLILSDPVHQVEVNWEGWGQHPCEMETSSWLLRKVKMPSTSIPNGSYRRMLSGQYAICQTVWQVLWEQELSLILFCIPRTFPISLCSIHYACFKRVLNNKTWNLILRSEA